MKKVIFPDPFFMQFFVTRNLGKDFRNRPCLLNNNIYSLQIPQKSCKQVPQKSCHKVAVKVPKKHAVQTPVEKCYGGGHGHQSGGSNGGSSGSSNGGILGFLGNIFGQNQIRFDITIHEFLTVFARNIARFFYQIYYIYRMNSDSI